MAFEQKDNSGALFRNNDRSKDTDPTHTGSAKIDGVEYWVSAWVNESRSGVKYFSMKFNPKQAAPVSSGDADSFDADVPF